MYFAAGFGRNCHHQVKYLSFMKILVTTTVFSSLKRELLINEQGQKMLR
jgi:hypothetical protein